LDKLKTVSNFLDFKTWDSDDQKLVVGITVKYCYTFIGLFSLSSKMKTSKIIQAKDADFAKILIFNVICVTFIHPYNCNIPTSHNQQIYPFLKKYPHNFTF